MNDLKGIIEDCNKSDLVSDKIIKKIIEIIGREEWQDLHDENNDICTTMGELIITLKGIAELEKEKCELLGIIQGKDEAIKDLEWQLQEVAKDNDNYQKENAELETDNVEWEKASDKWKCLYDLTNNQLTKAKEIIKKLKALYFSPVVTKDDVKRQDEILADVEQFLNGEVEK